MSKTSILLFLYTCVSCLTFSRAVFRLIRGKEKITLIVYGAIIWFYLGQMRTSLGARTCHIVRPIRVSLSNRGLNIRLLNKCWNIRKRPTLPHTLPFFVVFLWSNLIEIKRIKWRSHTSCLRREDFQCLKRNVNEKTIRTTKLGCGEQKLLYNGRNALWKLKRNL